jgi:hypothetical protein
LQQRQGPIHRLKHRVRLKQRRPQLLEHHQAQHPQQRPMEQRQMHAKHYALRAHSAWHYAKGTSMLGTAAEVYDFLINDPYQATEIAVVATELQDASV